MVTSALSPIPAKRYFTIGEVAELCDVKPHVLRYWEQEFAQLRPMKRRGNRRYYQHHEVLMIRRIRDLLYDEGFTISGARGKLQEWVHAAKGAGMAVRHQDEAPLASIGVGLTDTWGNRSQAVTRLSEIPPPTIRDELLAIRRLLEIDAEVAL